MSLVGYAARGQGPSQRANGVAGARSGDLADMDRAWAGTAAAPLLSHMNDFTQTMEIDLDTLEDVTGGAGKAMTKPNVAQDALAGCLDGAAGNKNLLSGCAAGAGKRVLQDLGKLFTK
jgi:hypothetical protein